MREGEAEGVGRSGAEGEKSIGDSMIRFPIIMEGSLVSQGIIFANRRHVVGGGRHLKVGGKASSR